MTPDQIKAIEPILVANLGRTIDFVKFGEAKNAALLTFASAWILASGAMAAGEAARACWEVRLALTLGAPCFVLAAFLAWWSFLPKTVLSTLRGRHEPNPRNSYLFFGDLASLPADGLPARLAHHFLGPEGGLSQAYLEDIGCQIVVNAKIAARKFSLFRWGVIFLGLGLAVYALTAALLVQSRWMG